ncbi:trimethylamine methyltransferase family protein [Aliisedimentitalea scapharcae]|uniref:Trimethylamine methyltransferase family protein n=1 Tax=Aliisedimentitalea scapharcae TaxID=1524259 RepID=A0ABZ2XUN4_9RHOB
MNTSSGTTRRGRRGRRAQGPGVDDARAVVASVSGGGLSPLTDRDVAAIDHAVRHILLEIGMAEAPADVASLICSVGGAIGTDGRLVFPPDLVDRALGGVRRDVTLFGQMAGHDLALTGTRVYAGSGGAAPMVVDLETGDYRPSTLEDLYDAARLVDQLDHIRFFSRSMVARDMPDEYALDINTAYACLVGTSKHVMVSAATPQAVRDIAEMCWIIAGSRRTFEARPFLSLNINHVVPPLRFSSEACAVLLQAAQLGIPFHVNTFGQMGASSPVTIAGCVAQTMAETLAGMIVAWAANPQACIVFGPRPMITDLRTGGMAGGSGEQALLTAAAVQMARHYGLPNSTIAGATDSKVVDAQSGSEKSLAVTLAAQTGANLITQAAGMLGGLMACSYEAYVADNDMLGAIMRTLNKPQVDAQTLALDTIADVAREEGHFLGQSETYRRMQSDFLYPQISDRRSPEDWIADGGRNIRDVARSRAREILETHYPAHIPTLTDASLRQRFDIRLPPVLTNRG